MTLKTHEILELARLDAMGMLDEDERVVFEQAFRHASPALQDQIRREQNRLTDIGDLLPDVDPPQDLRARVILRVREAVSAVAGRNADVIARIEPLAINMRRNVTPLWRAACIGFATATVVLLGFAFNQQSTYDNALQALRNGELAEQISRQLGPQFKDVLFSPTADKVNFVPVADASAAAKSGSAVVFIDREKEVALLVCTNLPKVDGQYALVITNDKGEIISTVATFESGGELNSQPLPNNIAPSDRFAIYAMDTSSEPARQVLVSL
ncbi:MAG: hypothetical protein H6814_05515 [Phycisphaeraceae bacterium]|nr:hypothetical protein [Phycisphaeraceae bacterium]